MLSTASSLHTDNSATHEDGGTTHEDDGAVHKDDGAVRHNVLIFGEKKNIKKNVKKKK